MGGAGWRTGGSGAPELPCSSLTPQSLFERQGLPGPEKLPGSLRKGIPRTKSVGMAGPRDCWGLGWLGWGGGLQGWRTPSLSAKFKGAVLFMDLSLFFHSEMCRGKTPLRFFSQSASLHPWAPLSPSLPVRHSCLTQITAATRTAISCPLSQSAGPVFHPQIALPLNLLHLSR